MEPKKSYTYTNPLMPTDFPDPSILHVPGIGYFAYGTHDEFSPTVNSIQVSFSRDMVSWSAPKAALTTPPSWAKTSKKFWAPDVKKVDDEYRLYYSCEPDTKDGMCLALAKGTDPLHFTDVGAPIARLPGSDYQLIDPCFFIDPKFGMPYLYYGSGHEPIRVAELSEDGMQFISVPVAVLWPNESSKYERLREGAYVTYKKEYDRYFLWVSGSNTWEKDSYAVTVFWSQGPAAPFEPIPGNHVVLKGNERWDSPGQNCIMNDSEDQDWMIYHAVDTSEPYLDPSANEKHFMRKMCMDKVHYTTDGWPYIENNAPSFTAQPGVLP